jgi:hypothetical protein
VHDHAIGTAMSSLDSGDDHVCCTGRAYSG